MSEKKPCKYSCNITFVESGGFHSDHTGTCIGSMWHLFPRVAKSESYCLMTNWWCLTPNPNNDHLSSHSLYMGYINIITALCVSRQVQCHCVEVVYVVKNVHSLITNGRKRCFFLCFCSTLAMLCCCHPLHCFSPSLFGCGSGCGPRRAGESAS